jgi:hypothetical protein
LGHGPDVPDVPVDRTPRPVITYCLPADDLAILRSGKSGKIVLDWGQSARRSAAVMRQNNATVRPVLREI